MSSLQHWLSPSSTTCKTGLNYTMAMTFITGTRCIIAESYTTCNHLCITCRLLIAWWCLSDQWWVIQTCPLLAWTAQQVCPWLIVLLPMQTGKQDSIIETPFLQSPVSFLYEDPFGEMQSVCDCGFWYDKVYYLHTAPFIESSQY